MKIVTVGLAAVLIAFAMYCFQVPQQIGWVTSWLLVSFITLALFVVLSSHVARLEKDAADYQGEEYEP